ncbi:uncharacterized protein M421DRAFT_409215, partial [Didymella exigua CBS 183.55]
LKLTSKITLLKNTRREIASAYYQLKLGHGYNKAYLYNIQKTESSKCSCGYTQTPQHLLLSCRNYREARKKIKSSLQETRLTMSLLLDTNRGI